MIELELPCCGGVIRLAAMTDEIRCEDCGIVADLAPDPVVVEAERWAPTAPAIPALAA